MSSPSEPDSGQPGREGVNLGKDAPAEQPFDPYRFGRPDHPIPAEYAPPGYTGPTMPAAGRYGEDPSVRQANPYGPPPQYPQYPPNQPYGYGPPPPPYSPYQQPRAGNGKAIAALVLGICSIVFCWLSFFDGIFVILGLVFSLVALSEARHRGGNGHGMALAGLICTIAGAVLATAFSVWIVHVANQCGGFSNSNDPGWSTCVQNHI